MTKWTPHIYGQLPKDLGIKDYALSGEMMFWLYCPIKMPEKVRQLPDNLTQFFRLICDVASDVVADFGFDRWRESYVYLTAKTLYVSPQSPGNRLGWHSDGFGTDDLNYIWADRNPTLFFDALGEPYTAPVDHTEALKDFDYIANNPVAGERNDVTYPDRSLLRLDQTVIHAVNPNPQPGLRTFLKVSVSKEPYALKGNSINHLLPDHPRPTEERQAERNHPQGNMNEVRTKEAA
ncbi:hypothetical protein [Rhizobium sp. BK376]|uniref:hypothetical protein n=1 Tax=Rhizobium sp. BK376 TaxID=2512149 RepID=UPI00104EDE6B|nr:hypothetical protein [Rhizobium sp. BK376]TCR92613.1 hypothetical protein EV561_10146 [Rhizobium sp. BK376]